MFESLFLLAVLRERRGWKADDLFAHKWAVAWLMERDVKTGHLGLEIP